MYPANAMDSATNAKKSIRALMPPRSLSRHFKMRIDGGHIALRPTAERRTIGSKPAADNIVRTRMVEQHRRRKVGEIAGIFPQEQHVAAPVRPVRCVVIELEVQ